MRLYFNKPLPDPVSKIDLQLNSRKFTVDDVKGWVEKYAGVEGRLRWYEMWMRSSLFYQLVARPLLSIRTVGSMNVERLAKPVKHSILTKDRNRLADSKAIIIFRAGQNLKLLQKLKTKLKKEIV